MAQLAIKGHETRGREVIGLLERLGGENMHLLGTADMEPEYYQVDEYEE